MSLKSFMVRPQYGQVSSDNPMVSSASFCIEVLSRPSTFCMIVDIVKWAGSGDARARVGRQDRIQ